MSDSPRKVLIVDDSVIAAAKLRTTLAKLGYEVVGIAETGAAAVTQYRELRPDLVTMDITMPDMDGVTATQHIVEEFPDASIIMVTSHGQERMVMDALNAGAVGYVFKPIKVDALSEALAKIQTRFETQ